jgi:hypothetical protein
MLIEQIKKNQIQARKARNALEASLLTTLIGELETAAKSTGKAIDDAAVVATVKKFIKNIEQLLAAAPSEAAEAERALLQQYLPKQLSEDQLRAAITEIIGAGQAAVGQIMGELKKKFSGQYDGALASKLVKEMVQ